VATPPADSVFRANSGAFHAFTGGCRGAGAGSGSGSESRVSVASPSATSAQLIIADFSRFVTSTWQTLPRPADRKVRGGARALPALAVRHCHRAVNCEACLARRAQPLPAGRGGSAGAGGLQRSFAFARECAWARLAVRRSPQHAAQPLIPLLLL
jgi:hypothetical protein